MVVILRNILIFIFVSFFTTFSYSKESVETIYLFKEMVTLDKINEGANSIIVSNGRFLEVGIFENIKKNYPDAKINLNLKDKIAVPGFIEHHIHPFLSSLTMNSKVISIDSWNLDGVKSPSILSEDKYIGELKSSIKKNNSNNVFISWGYHHYFHGKLTRKKLDQISKDIPILIIHRSFHEFIMNSKAIEFFGVNKDLINQLPEDVRSNVNLDNGHFSENGAFVVLPNLMKYFSKNKGFLNGLNKTVNYLHKNGITLIANPGVMPNRDLQNAKNFIFGGKKTPFKSYFIPNGMYLSSVYKDEELIRGTEEILNWGEGKVEFLSKHIKLFIDGAMYSQNMIMRDGYLDGHKGVWLMDKKRFKEVFKIYWDAGYQIHIHQNGDGGLDHLLDVLEENIERNPRNDHRTTIVHFGYSRSDQIPRLKKLGAIVSANPYYVTVLSDLYSKFGVGAYRSQEMVRLGEVSKNNILFSLHSDMPMAPASPLVLIDSAVNRINMAGKIAGPKQRINVVQALESVTKNSAYILGVEKNYGTISEGKYANITLLDKNPLIVKKENLKEINVVGTIIEGQYFSENYSISLQDRMTNIQ